MAYPTKMYVDTDKTQYVNGEKVVIDGMTDIYVPGAHMQFWIVDDHNVEIWRSQIINQPYNHGNYATVEPPLDIFKSIPPYYRAWGESYGLKGSMKFAYYK